MTPEQLIAVVVRLFAIGLILHSMRILATFIWIFETDVAAGSRATYIAVIVVLLVAVAVMWKFPLTIATRIYARTAEPEPITSWTPEDVFGCGSVLLGFYFLIDAFSQGMKLWFKAYWIAQNSLGDVPMTLEVEGPIVINVIQLVIAMCLIIGNRGIAKLVYKIRYGGLSE